MMKKRSQSMNGFAKPQASLLHAGVPCNYIHGRLAAARQNVFEIRSSTSAFFQNQFIKVYNADTLNLSAGKIQATEWKLAGGCF